MKGIIIGAGIGGLNCAIALEKLGIEIEVFEAVTEVKAVGAGIWMASNAMQVFGHLGFADAVIREGVELQSIGVTDRHLKPIQLMPMEPIKERFKYGITAIHRARLHQLLIQQLKSREQLHLGKRLLRIEDDGELVTAHFADGSTAVGDFLIGADGIHSVVREQLFPNESQYKYSGQTCWRGVVDYELSDSMTDATYEAWGGKVRLGVSSIGHGQTYWFAVKKTAENGKDNPNTLKELLLQDFSKFASPLPEILEATAIENIVRNDIGNMSPLKKWAKGRVCLIGDAAHSMTPNMGQGGGQAVEDAYVLAKLFKKSDFKDPQPLFILFQAARIKKVSFIIRMSKMLGKVAHWTWAQGFRNSMMRLFSKNSNNRLLYKIFDLDAD